jgi:predicted metal-dependent hydrolase
MKYFPWIIRRKRIRRTRKSPDRKKYIEQKEQARLLVKNRLDFWNLHYKFKYGRVSIRNQRSRWGSCSSKGNLNFNFRIVTLPPHLVDYIIVHELCHRGEFNHSQKFWDLVSETQPDYEKLVMELRKIRI